MTPEDITRMARESGFEIGVVTGAIYAPTSCETELKRFAALVAAEEREACAKLCENIDTEYDGEEVLATWCAAVIRARGEV